MKKKRLQHYAWVTLCAMVVVSMLFFTVAPFFRN